jgi:hypothetical protein
MGFQTPGVTAGITCPVDRSANTILNGENLQVGGGLSWSTLAGGPRAPTARPPLSDVRMSFLAGDVVDDRWRRDERLRVCGSRVSLPKVGLTVRRRHGPPGASVTTVHPVRVAPSTHKWTG